MEPGKGTQEVAQTLKIPLESHGFIQQRDHQLFPFEAPKDGVFVAGAATSPKAIEDSITGGAAAAMRVVGYLNEKGRIKAVHV